MKWWGEKKQMRDEPPAACLHCLYDGGENRTLSAAGGKLYLLGLMRKRWFIRGCSQFQWALAVIRDIAQINPNAQRPRLLRSHSSQHWLSLTLCLHARRVVAMPGLVFFVFHYKASGECHNLKKLQITFSPTIDVFFWRRSKMLKVQQAMTHIFVQLPEAVRW